MPNTTSTPTASSERTSDWAPVTRTGVPAGGVGFGRAGVPGRGGPGVAAAGAGRDVALVIGSLPCGSRCSAFEQQKTLVDRCRSYEGRAFDAARLPQRRTRLGSTRPV